MAALPRHLAIAIADSPACFSAYSLSLRIALRVAFQRSLSTPSLILGMVQHRGCIVFPARCTSE
jgi:hypothetical protein